MRIRISIPLLVLLLALITLVGVLADSHTDAKNRLEFIEKKAFSAARDSAAFARNDVVALKGFIEDLEAYGCSPSVFKREKPASFSLYSELLMAGWNNAVDLSRYLTLAYTARGLQPPPELIRSLHALSLYYVDVKNTVMRYSSIEDGGKVLNCSAVDKEALDTLEAALQELSILDSIDEISPDLVQRISDSVYRLEPLESRG